MNACQALQIAKLYMRLTQLGLLGSGNVWSTTWRFGIYTKRTTRRITWVPLVEFLSKN